MPKKVLIVDDDIDQVTAARTALELAGYEVAAAHSGAEGVAMAMSERPDVIVLDVTMETMGAGFRAAREIRSDEQLRGVPLIMLTSINERATGLRYGADEEWNPVDLFLDKPLAADRLVSEIRKIAPPDGA